MLFQHLATVARVALMVVVGCALVACAHQAQAPDSDRNLAQAATSVQLPAPGVAERGAPIVVAPAPEAIEIGALRVLTTWHDRRIAALTRSSVPRLRRLYGTSAAARAALKADVAYLSHLRQRRLTLLDQPMQQASVRVLRHTDSRWHLRVVDRIERSVVTGLRGSHTRTVRLPGTAFTERRLRFTSDGHRWRLDPLPLHRG